VLHARFITTSVRLLKWGADSVRICKTYVLLVRCLKVPILAVPHEIVNHLFWGGLSQEVVSVHLIARKQMTLLRSVTRQRLVKT
jgi:hypothetical protein